MDRLNKYFHQYLNAKVIFGIDLLLSLLSSCLVLLSLNFVSSTPFYKGTFAIWWMTGALLGTLLGMFFFKGYKVVVRHTTLRDLIRYILTLLVKALVTGTLVGCICLMNSSVVLALFYDLLLGLFLMICIRLVMFLFYDSYKRKVKDLSNRQRVLVYGTSDKSTAAITRLQNSPHYQVVGFVSPDKKNKDLKITDLPVFVYQSDKELDRIVEALSVRCILFATEADVMKENNNLVDYCSDHGLKALIVPTIDEVEGRKLLKERVRGVKIEDLHDIIRRATDPKELYRKIVGNSLEDTME